MVDFKLITDIPAQTLYDDQNNDAVLKAYWGINIPSAKIQDRVLYKDGDWNTICLPFDMNETQLAASPLKGCTLMEMNKVKTAFNQTNGELTLYFDEVNINPGNDIAGDPIKVIKAGTPYLIKWAKPEGYVAYDGTNATSCSDIVEPVFANVEFSAGIGSYTATKSDDGNVSFVGTFNPAHLYDNPHTRYYLGANNKLFYPKNSFVQLNAFRAYFEINLGSWASSLTPVFNFHFGDDAMGITASKAASDDDSVWYSMDGRKLDTKPTTKGFYIHNGRKTVIK